MISTASPSRIPVVTWTQRAVPSGRTTATRDVPYTSSRSTAAAGTTSAPVCFPTVIRAVPNRPSATGPGSAATSIRTGALRFSLEAAGRMA